MRIVVDTNILVSARLAHTTLPAHLITLWREGRFEVLTSAEPLEELLRVTRYPKIRERLVALLAGRLINELRDIAVMMPDLSEINVSPDPDDNDLLATAQAGAADFLVTGDRRHLIVIGRCATTRIVTVRDFLILNRCLP